MKGFGVCVKNKPILEKIYLKKVEEYGPDLVVVLDKPIIAQDFLDGVSVPVVWIDHHPIVKRDKVKYFNSRQNDENEIGSVARMAYEISRGELWVASVGAISDYDLPDYLKEFSEKYPELMSNPVKDAGEALYRMKIGKLVKIMNFLLKGTTTAVRKSVENLFKIENPLEIVDGASARGKFLLKSVEKILEEYDNLMKRALKEKVGKNGLFLFIYADEKNSFTSSLSSELSYILKKKNPKLIVVGRRHKGEIKMSLRSSVLKLPPILENALVNVKGYGGGHNPACGACVSEDDFELFVENLKALLI